MTSQDYCMHLSFDSFIIINIKNTVIFHHLNISVDVIILLLHVTLVSSCTCVKSKQKMVCNKKFYGDNFHMPIIVSLSKYT